MHIDYHLRAFVVFYHLCFTVFTVLRSVFYTECIVLSFYCSILFYHSIVMYQVHFALSFILLYSMFYLILFVVLSSFLFMFVCFILHHFVLMYFISSFSYSKINIFKACFIGHPNLITEREC